MAMKQVGIATLNPGAPDQVWGKCRNFELADEAEKEALLNGDGDTVGVIFSDCKKKCSGEFTPLAGQNGSPAADEDLIGKTLEITMHGESGKKYTVVVESASMSYEQGKSAKFKFEGYYYPNVSTTGTGGGA